MFDLSIVRAENWLLDRVTRLRDTQPTLPTSTVLRAQTSRRSLAGLGSELRDRLPCFICRAGVKRSASASSNVNRKEMV